VNILPWWSNSPPWPYFIPKGKLGLLKSGLCVRSPDKEKKIKHLNETGHKDWRDDERGQNGVDDPADTNAVDPAAAYNEEVPGTIVFV
jgi:hypothetical protein